MEGMLILSYITTILVSVSSVDPSHFISAQSVFSSLDLIKLAIVVFFTQPLLTEYDQSSTQASMQTSSMIEQVKSRQRHCSNDQNQGSCSMFSRATLRRFISQPPD